MRYKVVKFSLVFHTPLSGQKELVAKPLCKTAYYLCLLAQKDALSPCDLAIIETIGFYVRTYREK